MKKNKRHYRKRLLAIICSAATFISTMGMDVSLATAYAAESEVTESETTVVDLMDEKADESFDESAEFESVREESAQEVSAVEDEEADVNGVELGDKDILDFTKYTIFGSDDSFTEGVLSGTYKADDTNTMNVSVYKAGIAGYIAGNEEKYGFKCNKGKVLFSFEVPAEKSMYTLTMVGVNDGKGALYSDAAMENEVASGNMPGQVIFKNKDAAAQTVYFAIKEGTNFYAKSVEIEVSELKDEVPCTYKGAITGIEDDDEDVVLTFKSQTDTKTVTAQAYSSEGIELIVGENYEVSAVGTKAVYKGKSILAETDGASAISLTRVEFGLPLMLSNKADDYQFYLDNMGYISNDVTDAYTGLTLYKGALAAFSVTYGAKAAKENVISFDATASGEINVKVSVTVCNEGDKVALLNGNETVSSCVLPATATNSTKGGQYVAELKASVSEGDRLTLSAPVRGNLYIDGVSAAYAGEGWQVVNETASGVATLKLAGNDFVYHSPTTTIDSGSSGGKDYVRSSGTNGSASGGIVVTKDKSYVDYTAPADGTLVMYVGNASSKQGYVSTSEKAIGTYVPGGSDVYDSEGFKVVQGASWATLYIDVEKDQTYYICLSGSKMYCYGADFLPCTVLSGIVTAPA
ncbi:MAG: hypothetical protein IKR56_02680, partial [Lachnospiraceae bacterium]|nr:hypothetical protein [Lachnospiraceae bacterium]